MFMITLTILVVLLSLIYYYIKSAYFTLHGAIPGIPPQFFFGNLIQLGLLSRQPASIPDVVLRLKEKFGDVYQIWLGANRLIIISNLQDVQYIFSHRNIYDQGDLFTKNLKILNPKGILSLKGAEFKRHATFTGPLFRRGKILIHFNTIFDTTDKLLDRWRRHYTDQNEIHFNMIEQSQQLLLAIFGLIAFDYDLQTLDDQSNELTHAFYSVLNTMEILLKLPTFLGKIYMLLNWKITSLQDDEKSEANKSEDEKRGLSKYEVLCEMLAFLSAGYGTTSTSLSWFIFFMSKNPRIQQKIKDELAQFDGQRFSIEQLDSLVYLDCVLREIFRLVPPVLGTIRTLTADDQLPDSGFQLKKGDSVMISFYGIARDKRYWSEKYNLDEFHPERFLDDPENRNNPSALLTFGGGHRQCMGQDLARFELKIICARLMQFVMFGDGGEKVNSGGYDVTDTNKPKKLAVTVAFE